VRSLRVLPEAWLVPYCLMGSRRFLCRLDVSANHLGGDRNHGGVRHGVGAEGITEASATRFQYKSATRTVLCLASANMPYLISHTAGPAPRMSFTLTWIEPRRVGVWRIVRACWALHIACRVSAEGGPVC
jgi:hypothetical protein